MLHLENCDEKLRGKAERPECLALIGRWELMCCGVAAFANVVDPWSHRRGDEPGVAEMGQVVREGVARRCALLDGHVHENLPTHEFAGRERPNTCVLAGFEVGLLRFGRKSIDWLARELLRCDFAAVDDDASLTGCAPRPEYVRVASPKSRVGDDGRRHCVAAVGATDSGPSVRMARLLCAVSTLRDGQSRVSRHA